MRVALGCDHAGYPLKGVVSEIVEQAGHQVVDCGTYSADPVDYPDSASDVCAAVLDGRADRGIILCGSGVGAAVAANKITGIRAGLCHEPYTARQGVEHDDVNVLCLGGRVVGPSLLPDLVEGFLAAEFSGEERHQRRLKKVLALEKTGAPFDTNS